MSLRNRLLLGYLGFVAAMVILGGFGASLLRTVGEVSGRILSDNYLSVVVAEEMKENAERLHSAALRAALGDVTALAGSGQHRARFDEALAREDANITEPGEKELVEALHRERDLFFREFEVIEAVPPGAAPGASAEGPDLAAFERFFEALISRCDAILKLNQEAMLAKSENARSVARRSLALTLGAVGVLGVSGLALAFGLSGSIVRPVRSLQAAASRIRAGDLDVVAPVVTDDEIGALAKEFNRMAEHLRELRRSDLGMLLVAQKTAEAAVRSLYDPVLITDENGLVTRLNLAAEEIFGPEDRNRGRPVRDVTNDGRLAGAVTDTLRHGRASSGDSATSLVTIAIGGKEHAFRPRITPLRMEEGRIGGAVALLEDVTHLREIDRLKSEFVATASHELRTPLTSLQLGIGLLLEEARGEEARAEAAPRVLEACREDCERLEALIRDLLDLARFEARRDPPKLLAVRPHLIVEAAARTTRAPAEAARLKLSVEVPGELPDVLADATQIRRVIENLVANAVRNTPAGGTVTISAEARTGEIAFRVSDSGRGISPEYLARVFEKFVQIPGSVPGGAGLGLAISREIVESHGGRIYVQSERGRGTIFTFTLPLAGGIKP